jgi:hypothetical protein
MFSQTGAMMKKVRNSDNPMMIWLEGAPCSERAERTKESTMTIRVKQVINKMMDGASVSSVMTARTLMALSTSTGWLKPLAPMFKRDRAAAGVRPSLRRAADDQNEQGQPPAPGLPRSRLDIGRWFMIAFEKAPVEMPRQN